MIEFKMLPINAANKQEDGSSTDVIVSCEFKHSPFFVVEVLKYLKCLFFGELCHSCLFTCGSTFLSVAILLILFGSSQNQVIGIDTPRVVTFVQNVEFSGIAFVHHVRYPATKLIVTLYGNSGIPFVVGCSYPIPTIVGTTGTGLIVSEVMEQFHGQGFVVPVSCSQQTRHF